MRALHQDVRAVLVRVGSDVTTMRALAALDIASHREPVEVAAADGLGVFRELLSVDLQEKLDLGRGSVLGVEARAVPVVIRARVARLRKDAELGVYDDAA